MDLYEKDFVKSKIIPFILGILFCLLFLGAFKPIYEISYRDINDLEQLNKQYKEVIPFLIETRKSLEKIDSIRIKRDEYWKEYVREQEKYTVQE